jgi:formamidopyrimidine-DNA glycosylase
VPELPEVETIRRIVERQLLGLRLTAVELRLPKLLRDSPLPSLDPLIGQWIVASRRRAKVLILDWSNDHSLLVHFKLAGQFAVLRPTGERHVAGHPVPNPTGPYPHKTTHLILTFDDGTVAYHSDLRQFGWLRLIPSAAVDAAIDEFAFGPEAVGPRMFDRGDLAARLARRSIPIKQALLDQQLIAGLGNIYVDEALHDAAIHPARPARSLDQADLDRLAVAIPRALERGIEQGGAKIIHNRAYPIDGFPQVHARAGEPCPTCGEAIVKMRLGGRGTYFCPACQVAPAGAQPPGRQPARGENRTRR